MKLRIRRPDDMHLHLRDGEVLNCVVQSSAAHFGRALVMPNLLPPVTTGAMAAAYRERILAALPKSTQFRPMMSLYLTESTDPAEVEAASRKGQIAAVKLYPAGATTNSESGVRDINRVRGVLEVLAGTGTPLCVHGEVPDFDVDIFDREKVFIERVLERIRGWEPNLRIVLEHVTTCDGIDYVKSDRTRMAATITVHHLIINRNDIFRGGLRPHNYCLPVAKREHHRLALLEAATGGDTQFFLGTDSAPHLAADKECAVGCAGIYTAPVALSCLAHVFEDAESLQALEGFTSVHGANFYGLEPNAEFIELRKRDEALPRLDDVTVGDGSIVVFDPGFDLRWKVVDHPEPAQGG